MSLIVFNGSPRGKNSNSSLITGWFTKNITDPTCVYLNKTKQFDNYIEASKAHDQLLFVFPLYVDGMPGQVKAFMEQMYACKEDFKGKDITFIIHSGFTENIHSQNLKQYLIRFSNILGLNNKGVIVIPGSEGFRLMPPNMTQKKADMLASLGSMYSSGTSYDESILEKLSGIRSFKGIQLFLFKLVTKIGLVNIHWNRELKKNNAYDKRFDQPYV